MAVKTLKNFTLGTYEGLVVEAENETDYLNGLLNEVIANSVFEFDQDAVSCESQRMASDLEIALKEAKKPVAAFMYLNGIPEGGLVDYCAKEHMRGCMEDAVLGAIAEKEGICVDEADLAAYRRKYLEEYSKALFDGMGPDEEPLKKAILAKKTLMALGRKNEWNHR